MNSPLISAKHRQKHAFAHQSPIYGNAGKGLLPSVLDLAKRTGVETILDYGAGKGALAQKLRGEGYRVAEYDPAIPGKQSPPVPADMVVCNEVLEHIEPDRLDAALDHIQRLMGICGLFNVRHVPAILQVEEWTYEPVPTEGPEWWHAKISKRFSILKAYAQNEARPSGKVVVGYTAYAVAPISRPSGT